MSRPARFDLRQTAYRLGALLLLREAKEPGASQDARDATQKLLEGAPKPPRRGGHPNLYAVVHVAAKLFDADRGARGTHFRLLRRVPPKLVADAVPPIEHAYRLCVGALVSSDSLEPSTQIHDDATRGVQDAVVRLRNATALLTRPKGFGAVHSAKTLAITQIDRALTSIEAALPGLARPLGATNGEAMLASQVTELLKEGGLEWFEIAVITEQGTEPGASKSNRDAARDRVRKRVDGVRQWAQQLLKAAAVSPNGNTGGKRRPRLGER